MTNFYQVKDGTYTTAPVNSLNNTDAFLTISNIDTTKFSEITTGYIVTIWNSTLYKAPHLDPNMEKAVITALVIGASGEMTLNRGSAVAHTGSPIIAVNVVAQHFIDIQTAINNAETAISGKASASHTHNITDINAAGTADSTTYLRGDGTWSTPPMYTNFEQAFTASSLVTVNHNLDRKPSVTVIDSSGDECFGDVDHINNNSLTVAFSAPFTGSIICN